MGKVPLRCRVCWVREKKQRMVPVTDPCAEGPRSIRDAILLCVPTSTIKEDDFICKVCFEQLTPAFQFVALCLETEKLLEQEKSKKAGLPNIIQGSEENHDNDEGDLNPCSAEHSPEPSEEISVNGIDANAKALETPSKFGELLDFGLDNLRYISVPIQPSENLKTELTRTGVNIVNLSSDPTKKKRLILLTRDLDMLYRNGPAPHPNSYLEREADSSKTVFSCRHCPAQIDDVYRFRQHCVTFHKNKRAFSCRRCGKEFYSYQHLLNHEKMFEGEDKCSFQCARCKKVFKSKAQLQRHQEDVADAPSCKFYKCNVCFVKFKSEDFKNHCKEHANFLCVKCGKCLTSACSLSQHEIKSHPMEAHPTAESRAQDYMCEKCGKIFQSSIKLRSHIRGAHKEFKCLPVKEPEWMLFLNAEFVGGELFICDKCARPFTSKRCLTLHYNLKHSTKAGSVGVSRAFFCNKCNKVCLTKSGLKHHMRFIHPFSNPAAEDANKIHSCPGCHASFRTESELQEHQSICVGPAETNEPLTRLNSNTACVCRICHKIVGKIHTLKLHYKGHLGLRQFACHICGRKTQSHLSLRRHLLKHAKSTDKFSCKICQVSMSSFVELEEHMDKLHLKKRYKCKYCPQKFGLRMLWLSHESIEHEEINAKKEKLLKMLMSQPIFLRDRRYVNSDPRGSTKKLRMDVDELVDKLKTSGEIIDENQQLEAVVEESNSQKNEELFTEEQYACEVLQRYNLME
ncbi:hypothetical protein HUJ05_006137 [Dendroctonus ponderosae]|nr:hypothetical protein HUJ05_006137 [Dendroctonus ponderosae]